MVGRSTGNEASDAGLHALCRVQGSGFRAEGLGSRC